MTPLVKISIDPRDCSYLWLAGAVGVGATLQLGDVRRHGAVGVRRARADVRRAGRVDGTSRGGARGVPGGATLLLLRALVGRAAVGPSMQALRRRPPFARPL